MFGLPRRFVRKSAVRGRAAPGAARAPSSIQVSPRELEARAQAGGRRHSRQTIDLAYIRAAFGSNWPRVAPRFAAIMAQILEQQIGNQGCFAEDGDRYLILFERTSSRAAQAKVRAVAAKIARLLPGGRAGSGG